MWLVLREPVFRFSVSNRDPLKLIGRRPSLPGPRILLPFSQSFPPTPPCLWRRNSYLAPVSPGTLLLSTKPFRGPQREELLEMGGWEPSANAGTATRHPIAHSLTCLHLGLETGHLGPFLMLRNDIHFSDLKNITCSWIFKMNDGSQMVRFCFKNVMWKFYFKVLLFIICREFCP